MRFKIFETVSLLHKPFLTLPVFILCVLMSFQTSARPLQMGLNLSEGGVLTIKAISKFEKYMSLQSCEIKINTTKEEMNKHDIYFVPLELPKVPLGFNQALSIRVMNNEPLTSAILIKSSTGISELSSVQSERLAIISHSSYVGAEVPKKMLLQSGIQLDKKKIYSTKSYIGALSLLLHGDVFIAAIPGPLARQWLTHNKLSIITESERFRVGGLLFNTAIPKKQKESCMTAFENLKKDNRRDRKMNIFPEWLEGFKG